MKKALRLIANISHDVSEGIYMDELMDGSGECGHLIVKYHLAHANQRIKNVLKNLGVTLEQVEKQMRDWANKEMMFGPKERIIKHGRGDKGIKIPKDWADTKYGHLLCELNYITNRNND